MSAQYKMPDPERIQQQVAKLRRTRLEMEAASLELEEVNAILEKDIRQSLNNSAIMPAEEMKIFEGKTST